MPLTPPRPRYVADLFAPLHRELIALLRGLTPEQWELPTVAGAWRVRDVVAHLLDGMLRKLSRVSADRPLTTYEEVVAFINELNATGVAYWRRASPAVLTDLLERAGEAVAMEVMQIDPHATARISVAWAGEDRSENWMDTGREYTEWWHHQTQIRDAVGAPPLFTARWLAPLLDFSVRALPRAYASSEAPEQTTVSIYIDGEAWTVRREGSRWVLYEGATESPATKIRLDADTAWRIFYNAPRGRTAVVIEGDPLLAEPLLRTRSVMV
ncbi:MAG TPA: maleylpyruvate isomerase N-terminal domain-containing protein [Thermoanaerobaculia bacterium]|jgi:uncharacterized protein (TIGR03083 family)